MNDDPINIENCKTGADWIDVIRELNARLKARGIEPEESGFSDMARYSGKPLPDHWRWVACFPVTGGNEGFYVHIELITDSTRTLVGLAKTWTWQNACDLANHAAQLLGA